MANKRKPSKRFENFVGDIHPDVDHLLSKTVEEAFNEIGFLAEDFRSKMGKEYCNFCGYKFNELDIKMSKSRPSTICIACFTSNA